MTTALPGNRKELQAYLNRLDLTIRRTEARLAEYETRFGRRSRRARADDDLSPDLGDWSGEREMLARLKQHRDEVVELLKKP